MKSLVTGSSSLLSVKKKKLCGLAAIYTLHNAKELVLTIQGSIGPSEDTRPDPEVILDEIIQSHMWMKSMGTVSLNIDLEGDKENWSRYSISNGA